MKKLNLFLITMLSYALILLATSCGGGTEKENSEKDTTSKSEITGSTTNSNNTEEIKTEEQTPEDRITEIRAKFQEIESNLKNYTVIAGQYANPDPEKYWDLADYTSYNSGNEAVKIIETAGEEGYEFTNNYYFDNGKIIFIFTKGGFMGNPYLEERIYFDNEENVIKALIKSKDQEDETTKLSSLENKDNKEFIKDPANFSKMYAETVSKTVKCSKEVE